MSLTRRELLTCGMATAMMAGSSVPGLGQSENPVIDHIRSRFDYVDENTYFTDQAIERAQAALSDKASIVKEAIDGLAELTELRTMRADDLPRLDRMTPRAGPTPADGLERIQAQVGASLPHEMMRHWLDYHLYHNDLYAIQGERREWYVSPQELASYVEDLNVGYLYPDLLDLAFWNIRNRPVQPRPVSLDVGFVQEIKAAADAGNHGLQRQDRPSLNRRYLYEFLQNEGREDLLFERATLAEAYRNVQWERPQQARSDRQEALQRARAEGVHAPSGVYLQTADQLSSTALTYIHVSDQLITDDALQQLKAHILGDFEDKTTEWGGRVMIQDGRFAFKRDPVSKRESNDLIYRDLPKYVASDFSAWHAHAIESLSNPGFAGPSYLDLTGGASRRAIPEFVVTPVYQRGDTLKLNIDIYQAARECPIQGSGSYDCPWAHSPERVDSFIVDLGIFET
ncbi:MAG: hypothetical protein ABEL51_09825 [Salinibacter sp.]